MITALAGVVASSISQVAPYDPDAQAFFTAESAAGVTLTPTQKTAVNNLVLNLKAANIWTKFKALYPVVGGTATAHKFNLKNPADTDAAFRLVFTGGWTHSSNGMLPNGTNAYADSFVVPNTNLTNTNYHFSYYSRTQSNNNSTDIGAYTLSPASSLNLSLYKTSISLKCFIGGSYPTYMASNSDTNTLGFMIGNRTSSTILNAFWNGTRIGLNTTSYTGSVPIAKLFIAALSTNNNPSEYGAKQCALASIGDGLTEIESQVFNQIVEGYQYELGRNINPTQSFYYNPAYNNETNAFLYSTQITNTTIQTATNTMVSDLKTANLWTKMKALYPMVGGTATTHKFNLINSQDTNSAFRLNFVGGWTHGSNGALPNGTNAYTDTFLTTQNSGLTNSSGAYGIYSRTNPANTGYHGSVKSSPDSYSYFGGSSTSRVYRFCDGLNQLLSSGTLSQSGLILTTRTSCSVIKGFRNGVLDVAGSSGCNSTSAISFYFGAYNNQGSGGGGYSNQELALAFISDGLVDLDVQLFYQITEKFQVALGRSINPLQSFYYNPAYNNETNAFLYSTQITDTTIQTATNTLVNDMKVAGVWTKMKAVYPMVGGTATTHKYNLVNSQDNIAAFRLNFLGGWVHSSTGAKPDGINSYAQTFLVPSTLGLYLMSIGYYSRTNSVGNLVDMGVINGAASNNPTLEMYIRVSGDIMQTWMSKPNSGRLQTSVTDSRGFFVQASNGTTTQTAYKNGVSLGSNAVTGLAINTYGIFLAAENGTGTANQYSNRECAFSFIGDGLSSIEVSSLYTIVQNFNTTLGRQMP
jgi:hypothetical protein